MDNFFNKGFKGAKCKTLLKLAIPRIKLLRNRREIQLKNMRRDIAKLLETGQEATARIRVEHIIREENMLAAQEIIGLLCELIVVRLPIIETQKECPLDLKEAISSVCFAARRCSDLPELQQVEMLFAMKYGKEFVSAATELMPNCGVNRQIIELLSIRPPSPEVKLKLLKEIADEHELDWDPSATETEFLKPHEDLLNGPTQFISGSKQPLPKEKHNETLSSAPVHAHDEQSDSDLAFDLPEVPKVSLKPSRFTGSSPDMATPLPNEKHNEPLSSSPIAYHDQSDSDLVFDSLDFPEVQKVSLNPSSSTRSSAEMAPPLPTTSPELEPDLEIKKPDQDITYEYYSEPKTSVPEGSVPAPHPSSNISVNTTDDKQFIPFDCPPLSSASFSVKNAKALSQPGPTLLKAKSEAHIDLQDVLAAAHAAAESAERAAAAARSAASLAQLRISKLFQKRNEQVPDNSDNTFQMNSPNHPIISKSTFDQCHSFNSHINASHSFNRSTHQGSTSPQVQSHDSPKMEPEIGPGSGEEQDRFHQSAHLPQRSSSLEDDPYFSYPNLFSSPNSIGKFGLYSSEDNLPSIHKT